MIKAIIISGFCFVVGNIVWVYFDEPKLFYVPLSVFLLLLLIDVKNGVSFRNKVEHIFLTALILLAASNVIKQLFYTTTIKQINDYVWGALVGAWAILKLIKLWATRKPSSSSVNS